MRNRARREAEAPEGPRLLLPAACRAVARRLRLTPETAILAPVAAVILLSLLDFGLIVGARWEMEAAAREAARSIARDGASPAAAAAAARRRLDGEADAVAFAVTAGPVVVVEISRPTHDLCIFGFWRLVAPERLAMRGEARRLTPASEADR